MSDESTAVTPSSPDLDALSSSDLAHWRSTGEIKVSTSAVESETPAPESDVTPESSPAAEIAASSPAASEPAPPKKANAESRKAELNAEILALKAERDALKADRESWRPPTAKADVTTASSPVTQPVSIEQVIDSPDISQPLMKDAEFSAQFPDATVADYARYSANYAAELRFARKDREQHVRELKDTYFGRLKDLAPEVIAKIPTPLMQYPPVDLLDPKDQARAGTWNYAATEILRSPNADKLVTYLADHPEDVERITATRDYAETIRTIAQIEARLDLPSVPVKSVVKTTTSAPPPPTTLGTKPAIPSDELDEALASNDVARYLRVANAREMAQKR